MESINSANVVAAILMAVLTNFVYLLFHNRPSSTKIDLQKRGLTFRLCGVPLDWEEERLRALLARQYGSAAGADIKSLAVEIHGRSRTATLAFQTIPHQMRTAQAPWQIPLPLASSWSTAPSQALSLDDGFLGITTLYAPPSQDHKVDIVAVCGLGGHAFGSFKERNGEHMWLRDALPHHIIREADSKPYARVMVYGYQSSLPQSQSIQNFEDLATSLHTDLLELVSATTPRPIIFIAHSLGGLIVKQALISLSISDKQHDKTLLRAVYGIVFFGVPHGGMDISSLIPMVGNGPNRFLLESIQGTNSQILSIQQREFPNVFGDKGKPEVFCFYETRLSPTAELVYPSKICRVLRIRGKYQMLGLPAILVTKDSATRCPPWENGPHHICAVDRNHSEMVKFGAEDAEYRKALVRIKGVARRALAAHHDVVQAEAPLSPPLSPAAQDCLKSLSFPEMNYRSKGISAAAPETCQWLLEHEKYNSWTACNRGLLWIKGKPGSGKSTLLRYALDNVATAPSFGDRDIVLSFFFHGRGVPLQRTPVGLFRSLLHQLLYRVPDTLADLIATFQKWRDVEKKTLGEEYNWYLNELQGFLAASLPKILEHQTVWIYIDALDESGDENARDLVRRFKSLLKTLPSTCQSLRICFACRHYPIVSQDYQFIIIPEEQNRDDISAYIRARLGESKQLKASNIPNLIAERANGVFMWALLMADQVIKLDDEGEGLGKIEECIRSVHPELKNLYSGLIRDMDKPQASLRLIQWICFAMRPLSLDELRWAMVVRADCPHRSLQQCRNAEDLAPDIDTMQKRLRTLSRGLAEVVPSSHSDVVQFIHQSVKDFFVDEGLAILTDSLKSAEPKTNETNSLALAHYQLSRSCLRYLAMDEIRQSTTRDYDTLTSKFPLLDYATRSWIAHEKQREMRGNTQDDLLDYFNWPQNDPIATWIRIHRIIYPISGSYPPKTLLIHVASRHGLLEPLRGILDGGSEINAKDGYGQTPLSRAAENGREAAVQLLLDRGTEIDTKDNYGRTPLLRATQNGHEAVVQLLLDKGAEIDAKDSTYGQTPLSWAAENGCDAVVQLLLDKGAEINAKDSTSGQTPLSWAAGDGREAAVQLLLDKGAEIDAKDDGGWTPLSRAAENGYEAVVQLLLDKGAEIDAKGIDGRTPLSWAAGDGREAVVQLLIDKGAEIDAKDKDGRTPLSWAAQNGHEAVVQLLLDKGAEIDAKDDRGQTPLSWAAENGREAVVRLLLDKGAEIDAKDIDGRTPLSWAAENGHEAVVQLLLDKGAEIVAEISHGLESRGSSRSAA